MLHFDWWQTAAPNSRLPFHPVPHERNNRMETVIGKVLNDVAGLAQQKWYMLMGLFGLIVFFWVLVMGTPHDDVLVGAIAIAMMGFGFGEAESRTFRKSIAPDVVLTTPVRQFTWPGLFLYLMGAAGFGFAIWRAFFV